MAFIFACTDISTIRTMKETNSSRLADYAILTRIAEEIINGDENHINGLIAEVVANQTFLASTIVNYTGTLEPEVSEDIFNLYLVVWGLYRHFPECRDTAITARQFERVQQRNISMFRYLDQEDDNGQFRDIVRDDHRRLNHGVLMQYISHCFQSWKSLKQMETNEYCTTLVGIKSVIECLEEIAEGNQ